MFCRPLPDRPYFVFLCELKSGRHAGAQKSAQRQLANARLLCDYLVAMARHHCPLTEDIGALHYRALIFFAGHRAPKGSQRPGKFRYSRTLKDMPDVKLALLGCGATHELVALCDDA